jgi:pyruvate dehydrogenase E2 component (dihydrolipoamide acetyltransferase)
MPALSPTMEEGTLAKWKVKEGDKVSSGDVIAEIETDKATMEVEAVDEGVVEKILVPAGTEHVKVNATIAILLGDGEKPGAKAPSPAAAASPGPKANGSAHPGAAASARSAPQPVAPLQAGARPAPPAPSTHKGGRILASPLARRLAKDAGIDLAGLSGSGPHGRIVKRDLQKAGAASAKAGAGAGAGAASALDPRVYPADGYTAVKLDGMRKTIARRLKQSFNDEVPHFPLNIDVELTRLLEARAALNALSPKEGEGAFKLSVNDFVIKASALALGAVPAANATYTEEAILLHKHADIGVAVAIEGGLITPIIWKAESKGLKRISAEVKDLAARARGRKLKPEEYSGGTFSISNLGMFGITSFASIVNQPQGAILSVGAGEERAVVRGGAIVARTMMTVTLTCDHRVVDGAVGAEFLAAFKRFIEEPSAMLL